MGNYDTKFLKDIRPGDAIKYSAKTRMDQILKSTKSSTRVSNFNKELYDLGILWARTVDTLEEVPEEFKNSQNFINGFNFWKRQNLIKEKEIRHAQDLYYSGVKLSDLPWERFSKLSDVYIQAYYITKINDMKQQGRDFYNNGGILELLSDDEKEKLDDYFLIGYEEAKTHDKNMENKDKLR